MVVHIYGLPVDMDPVIEIAGNYGLKIIEEQPRCMVRHTTEPLWQFR